MTKTQDRDVTIYFNPNCTKCRETKSLLQESGHEPEVVEYLKSKPTLADLRSLHKKLNAPARVMIRTKEEAFKQLKLNLDDDEAVLRALEANPALLERPIVVRGDQAVIGRPPENIRKLL